MKTSAASFPPRWAVRLDRRLVLVWALASLALLAACAGRLEPLPTLAPTFPPRPTAAPAGTAAPAAITGRIWEDLAPVNGLPDSGEPGLAQVAIRLGPGQCPSTGLQLLASQADGTFAFQGLPAGSYCLVIDPVDSGNAGRLGGGRWTHADRRNSRGLAAVTLTLAPGEVRKAVDFGWERDAPTAVPTPTAPACRDGASFATDVTIPDNTRLQPGTIFAKTWRLHNTGSCDWTTEYSLAFEGGHQMSGPPAVYLVQAIPAGRMVDLTVNFMAPESGGTHQGRWRLRNEAGIPFGDTYWVRIESGAIQASPTPRPTNPPPTATTAPVGPTPAVPPPPSSGFELGGQVADFRAADRMQHAGMLWVKRQVRWQPGDTASADWVQDAHNRGFKILLSVVGHPDAIRDGGNYDRYAAFVGELARLGADGIEVWNEMNIDREWPRAQINPASYASLLRQAYQAIKAQNPATLVISGAPAPTGAEGAFGLDRVWNDDRYLAGLAAAGAAGYVDCVGVHYNEGILGPGLTSGDPRGDYFTRYYPRMVDTYFQAFGGARPLCFTELGYLSPEGYGPLPAAFGWAGSTTVAQQAHWLAEAARLARSSGRVRLMIVFNVDFIRYDDDPQAGFAILRPDGSCPACDSLRAVTGGR